MKNNQTAIEWLWERQQKEIYLTLEDFQEAKKIEKQQIITAWEDGDYAYFYSKKSGQNFVNGIEYYNEKFNKNEQDITPTPGNR